MLKIQFKDNRHPPLWVVEKLYSIGSAADNNLVLGDAGIDALHARLVSSENKVFLKDNNSQNGCFVNGQRVTQKEIFPGDTIKLGSVEIEVLDPHKPGNQANNNNDLPAWRMVSDSSWLAGKSFEIPRDKSVVIGRGTQCDIVIPGTHLSRRHAELTAQGTSLRVKDLSSANGTFINDRRVEESVAYNGDRLRIDVYSFRLVGPESVEHKTRVRAPLPIEALTKPVEKRQPSQEPKRWKTRPTSPGNRIEPVDINTRTSNLWWLVLVVVVAALIATVYLI
jgi:pSer/pThr/pTyr-binding forkhead associated (FHA) protein